MDIAIYRGVRDTCHLTCRKIVSYYIEKRRMCAHCQTHVACKANESSSVDRGRGVTNILITKSFTEQVSEQLVQGTLCEKQIIRVKICLWPVLNTRAAVLNSNYLQPPVTRLKCARHSKHHNGLIHGAPSPQ